MVNMHRRHYLTFVRDLLALAARHARCRLQELQNDPRRCSERVDHPATGTQTQSSLTLPQSPNFLPEVQGWPAAKHTFSSP